MRGIYRLETETQIKWDSASYLGKQPQTQFYEYEAFADRFHLPASAEVRLEVHEVKNKR